MTRNKKFNRPDEYEISWSSSGSEDEKPLPNKRSKWINLRILTPSASINESRPPSRNALDLRLTPSPTFQDVTNDLSPVINMSSGSFEKSPVIGKNRKTINRTMCQFSKRIDLSPDIFPTQYSIEFSDTQKSCVDIENASQPKVCVISQLDSSNMSEQTDLDFRISSQFSNNSSQARESYTKNKCDILVHPENESNNSFPSTEVSIVNCEDLSPAESRYEIDHVSSQDVDEIITGDLQLTDNTDFDICCSFPIKRTRFKKGGFASQTLAAIKYHEANVHIWKHEMYLSSTSGDEIPCVQPELVKKFYVISILEELGCKLALCRVERFRCLVLLENCDSSKIIPGIYFYLYPPYIVKQITVDNVCYDVYLSISKLLFCNK